MRITSKHVGKTLVFMGCNRAEGIPQTGTVREVSNGIAVVMVPYFLTESTHGEGTRAEFTPTREPWRVLLETNNPRIVGLAK